MVDNFEQIKAFYKVKFDSYDPDLFLFGQIIARKKDGAERVSSNNKVIKDFVISSPEDFDTKKQDIVDLCKFYKARAYINITPRSHKDVVLEMAGLCLDYIRRGSASAARGAFSTTCGRLKPKGGYWIIDVDNVNEIEGVEALVPEVAMKLPTVNGIHIITKGFDIRELCKLYPHVDIHKNNPTLLYFGG